jgi:hypothetical protein
MISMATWTHSCQSHIKGVLMNNIN